MSLPVYNASATSPNYSNELVQVPPIATSFQPLMPNQQHGRKRIATFTVPLLAQALNTTIGLCVIPKNARILNIFASTSATPGATVALTFGAAGRDNSGYIDDGNDDFDITGYEGVGVGQVADSTTYFGTLAASGAATTGNLAATAAQNVGYMFNKDCVLTATTTGASCTAAATLFGYVEYVTD